MKIEHSEFMGDLVEIMEAFSSRNEKRVAELLDQSERPGDLSRSVRFGFTNYQTEMGGRNFSENSTIWAIPVLIPKACHQFVSTSGNPIKIFDAASRMMVRKAFGAEYKITAFDGLIHADVLSGMPYLAQAVLLGKIAGDQRYEAERVCMEVQQTLCQRIESGEGAELCIIVGAATRYNRAPLMPEMSEIQRFAFANELKGRISLNCTSTTFDAESLQIGSISTLADAYEAGTEMLINYMSRGRVVGEPAISCTSNSNLVMRIGFYMECSEFLVREFPFNTSLISMESVEKIFNRVKGVSSPLPAELQLMVAPVNLLH